MTITFYTHQKDRIFYMVTEEKGQITLEAILILGFFILMFIAVSIPMTFNSRYAALDTAILTDAKFATEQIASAANTVIVNGSKKTIDVYIPGYKAGSLHSGTRICTDGGYINTTVLIVRYDGSGAVKLAESYNFSKKLYGSGWSMSTTDGLGRILEDEGRRYTLKIEYKSVTSNTANTMSDVTDKTTIECTDVLTSASLPTGWSTT